jgi:hypothetical protein
MNQLLLVAAMCVCVAFATTVVDMAFANFTAEEMEGLYFDGTYQFSFAED